MNRKFTAVAVAFVLMIGLVGSVFADASVVISGGALSQSPQSVGFAGVALTGADQRINDTDSSNWSAADPTGTGAGWHINISAANFIKQGDATKTIAVANFKVRVLDANITLVDGNTKPTSSITAYTSLSGTAQALMSAASGNGMGQYTYVPDFQLTVPAETVAGTYDSVVTVAIVSGP